MLHDTATAQAIGELGAFTALASNSAHTGETRHTYVCTADLSWVAGIEVAATGQLEVLVLSQLDNFIGHPQTQSNSVHQVLLQCLWVRVAEEATCASEQHTAGGSPDCTTGATYPHPPTHPPTWNPHPPTHPLTHPHTYTPTHIEPTTTPTYTPTPHTYRGSLLQREGWRV